MKMHVEGLRELERNLKQLTKATAKNAMRKALREAAKPTLEAAESMAPVDEGWTKGSLSISTKLNKEQTKLERREGKHEVNMYVGSDSPIGHLVEYGTNDTSPSPFMRPAWDQTQDQVLENIQTELAAAIDKAAARAAKKAARKK